MTYINQMTIEHCSHLGKKLTSATDSLTLHLCHKKPWLRFLLSWHYAWFTHRYRGTYNVIHLHKTNDRMTLSPVCIFQYLHAQWHSLFYWPPSWEQEPSETKQENHNQFLTFSREISEVLSFLCDIPILLLQCISLLYIKSNASFTT